MPIQFYWDSHFFFSFHHYLFHRFYSFIYGSILNIFNLQSFWWCIFICTLLLVNFSSNFDWLAIFPVNYPQSLWAESCFFLSLFPLPPLWPPPGPPLLVHITVFSWQSWSSIPILWVLQTQSPRQEEPGPGPIPSSFWLHCKNIAKGAVFWLP